MKKVSALLLTGIIGSSMLFAGFSGTASLSNTLVDFSDNSFGFSNDTTEWDASVELYATSADAMGEGDIYAEINATLSVALVDADETTGAYGFDSVDFDLDYARIVGDGWSVDITGVAGTYDYAADTIALDDDDDAYSYSVSGSTYDGVAVTLDDLGTLSVGYTGDFDDLTATKGYVALEAAEMEVAEGITAQVAASLAIDKTLAKNFEFGGSAKLAYAADDVTADLAADAGYNTNGFNFDVSLVAAMSPITLDAYFGAYNANGDFDIADTALTAGVQKLLNVKAVADLADFDVPVTLTLTGLDLINIQDLDAKAAVTLSEELCAYVSGGYVLDDSSWCVGAGATYTVDAYTATADVSYDGSAVAASASVESTTLVNGATLCLAWADGDDLFNSTLGSITASCEIAF